MGPEFCIVVNGEKFGEKSPSDLDLGPTMPNMELVRIISFTTMYLNLMFQDQFLFELSCKNTHTQTQTHTHTHMDTHKTQYLRFAKT